METREDANEDANWQPNHAQDAILKDPKFMSWWNGLVARRNAMGMPLGDDPRDPDYDAYALYKTGWNPPSNWDSKDLGVARGHFPSNNPVTGEPLKADTNPRAVVDGVDTRTGIMVAPTSYTGPLDAKIKANAAQYKDVKVTHTPGDGWGAIGTVTPPAPTGDAYKSLAPLGNLLKKIKP